MSKQDLYNSVKGSNPISRKEINKLLAKNLEGEKVGLDPFETEALEGWQSIGASSAKSVRLDKQFIKSSHRSILIGSGVLVITLLTAYLIYLNKNTAATNLSAEAKELHKNYVEETDLFIAEKFDTLVEIHKKNHLEIKILQETQESRPLVSEEKTDTTTFAIEKLPFLHLPPVESATTVEIVKKRKVKEIYLSEFKLVDYRTLRTKPQVSTKQLDLTGTSANKETKDQMDEEPIWKMVDVPYHDFIEKSMYTLNKGNLKKALARFEVILETYSDDVNALFYSGFVLFSLNEHERSLPFFSLILNQEISNFDEEAAWYCALCYEKMGELSKAKDIYTTIYQSNSFYSNQAKKKLEKM